MRSVRPGVGVEPSGFTPDGGGGVSIPRLTKWIEDTYCEVIKIVDGESPEECLKRELGEEFGIQVEVGEFITSNKHHYDHISIELMAFRVKYISIPSRKAQPASVRGT